MVSHRLAHPPSRLAPRRARAGWRSSEGGLQQSGLARLCNKSTVRMINRVIRVNAFPETSSGQRLSYTLNLGFLATAKVFRTGVGVGCQPWTSLGRRFWMDFEWDPGMTREKGTLGQRSPVILCAQGRPQGPFLAQMNLLFSGNGLKNVQIFSSHSLNAQSVFFVFLFSL